MKALYQLARERNPRRWSRDTRDWNPIGAVTLNPEREAIVQGILRERLALGHRLSS